jgi:hypothetical protein
MNKKNQNKKMSAIYEKIIISNNMKNKAKNKKTINRVDAKNSSV